MSFAPPLRAECLRLLRTRSTWLLVLGPALLGALRILFAEAAGRMERARQVAAGAGQGEAVAESGFGAMADGIRAGSAVLTLVLLLYGALVLVRERESGALGLAFLARSRGAVVLGKALAIVLLALVGFLVLALFCGSLAWLLHGLGAVVDEGFEMATAGELWRETLKGSLAALPALVAAGLFGLAVSSLSSGPGAAVAGTLLPFLFLDVTGGLFENVSSRLFVTYAPFLGTGSPLVKLADIARAYSDAEWRDGELLRAVLVPSLEGLVMVLLAIVATRRRAA